MRMCSMCRQVKDESQFQFKKCKNQYNYYCRDCERAYNTVYKRAYREMNPDYVERNRVKMREKYKRKE